MDSIIIALERIEKKIDDVHTEMQTMRITNETLRNQRDKAFRDIEAINNELQRERHRHNLATKIIAELKKRNQ
jgi:hypothetical protein